MTTPVHVEEEAREAASSGFVRGGKKLGKDHIDLYILRVAVSSHALVLITTECFSTAVRRLPSNKLHVAQSFL